MFGRLAINGGGVCPPSPLFTTLGLPSRRDGENGVKIHNNRVYDVVNGVNSDEVDVEYARDYVRELLDGRYVQRILLSKGIKFEIIGLKGTMKLNVDIVGNETLKVCAIVAGEFISGNGTGEVTDGVQWVYPLNGIHQRHLLFFSEFSSVSNSGLKVVISELMVSATLKDTIRILISVLLQFEPLAGILFRELADSSGY
ncbi:hypothetical protein Tco_0104419 [Tanacetum coccineum]